MEFVIDTGSPDSYLSEKEVKRFQISLKKPATGEVDFGGSRFRQVNLPRIDMFLLNDGKQNNDYMRT
jgi:hypothetical protein